MVKYNLWFLLQSDHPKDFDGSERLAAVLGADIVPWLGLGAGVSKGWRGLLPKHGLQWVFNHLKCDILGIYRKCILMMWLVFHFLGDICNYSWDEVSKWRSFFGNQQRIYGRSLEQQFHWVKSRFQEENGQLRSVWHILAASKPFLFAAMTC